MDTTNKKQLVEETLQLWRQIHKMMEETEPSPWIRLTLSREQLRILSLLFNNTQLSPGSVADGLGVPKANVTDVIQRLVRQGLVTRVPDLLDRRRHTLHLTEKGRDEVEQLREWRLGRTQRILQRISEKDLKLLAHGLAIMLATSGKSIDTPADREVSPEVTDHVTRPNSV